MQKNNSTYYLIKRLWKEAIGKHKLSIFLAFFFMILTALSEAISLKMLQPVIDKIFVEQNKEMLIPIAIIIACVFLVRSLASYSQAGLTNYIGLKTVADLQKKLFSHVISMDSYFFSKNSTGKLMAKFNVDAIKLKKSVATVLTNTGKDFFTTIFLIGLMLIQDATLALMLVVVFPVAFLPIIYLGKKMRKFSIDSQEETGLLTQHTEQVFGGIRVVKSYNMQKKEQENAKKLIKKIYDLSFEAAKTRAKSRPIMEFLGGLAVCVIILFGGKRVIDGYTTTGEFFSFIAALLTLHPPIKALANLNVNLQEGLAGAERLFSVLDSKRTMLISPPKRDFISSSGDIRFSDVSFSYEGTDVGIKDFSLEVKRGKTIALVGASGAGKSTIMNLLLRFYDVDRGVIELSDDKGDYFDIRDISLYDLRCQLSLVSQDVVLFDDTIRNNISYGSFGASQEDILLASKKAYADEFIKDLELGYDTIVGERGAKLSGGQKQRISIARAMLKDAPILLLDEATSALDTQSEQKVQSAIEKLMSNKTTIVIAHRLSTVQNADEIIVLDKGKIIEKGNHKNLMNKKGFYSDYFKKADK